MAELTKEEEVLAWDNAPEWMKRMVLGGSRHDIGTLAGQVEAAKGLGNRFYAQDYLDITTALNNYKTSGQNKVNALRRVMGRSAGFSMGSGGLTGSSLKSMMELQGKDILSKIIEMQSNAGLKTEREHRDWYNTMGLDPYYFEDAQKAFFRAEGERDRATAHDTTQAEKLHKRKQDAVDAQMSTAIMETQNVNDLADWLISKEVPKEYWEGAFEAYEKIATSQRAVADQLMQVETHDQTTDTYNREKRVAGEKKFADETMRDAGKEVAHLVRVGGMSLDEALEKINEKYSAIPYFTASGLETQAEALVGTRSERSAKTTTSQKLTERQLEAMAIPQFLPKLEVIDGEDIITEVDDDAVTASQRKINLLWIDEVRDREVRSPIGQAINRRLTQAQAWEHLLQLKNMTDSPINREDILRLRKDVQTLEGTGKEGQNEEEVMNRIMKFAQRYGIPFQMAEFINDPKKYIGTLASVSGY